MELDHANISKISNTQYTLQTELTNSLPSSRDSFLTNRTDSNINITSTLPNNTLSISHHSHEDEIINLRKQLRQQEIQALKEKAVLEQKIELLENQLQEARLREENINKMNQTILSAISDMNNNTNLPSKKTVRELELATEQHNKEMSEYRTRTSEIIRNLENENKNLKEKLNENELSAKELRLNIEKCQIEIDKRATESENEILKLQRKIKISEEDRIKQKDLHEYELQLKTNELKIQIERLKETHQNEIEKLQQASEKSLKEMKELYQSEKNLLESRLEKMQITLEKEDNIKIKNLREAHEKEIINLNHKMNEIKAKANEETMELIKQRDEAREKAENYLKQLKGYLKKPNNIQECTNQSKVEKNKSMVDNTVILYEENKKYKDKIVELKTHINKLEQTERKLKDFIVDKVDNFEFSQMLDYDSTEKHLRRSQTELNQQIKAKSNNSIIDIDSSMLACMNQNQGKFIAHSSKPSLSGARTVQNLHFEQENHKKATKSQEDKNRNVAKSPINLCRKNSKQASNSYTSIKKPKPPGHNILKSQDYSTKNSHLESHALDFYSNTFDNFYSQSSIQKNDMPLSRSQEQIQGQEIKNQDYTKQGKHHIDSIIRPTVTTTNKSYQRGLAQREYQSFITDVGFGDHNLESISCSIQDNYYGGTSIRSSDLFFDPYIEEVPSISHSVQNKSPYSHVRGTHKINSSQCYGHDNVSISIAVDSSKSHIMDQRVSGISTPNNINNQLNKSHQKSKGTPSAYKLHIEEKLKDLEFKLRDVELKNKGLKVEKGKVEVELEKLLMDLREKNENGEIKSEEDVMKLKNEIKFLLEVIMGKSKSPINVSSHSQNRIDTTILPTHCEQSETLACLSSITRSKENLALISENCRNMPAKTNLDQHRFALQSNHNIETISSPLLGNNKTPQKSYSNLDHNENSNKKSQCQSQQQQQNLQTTPTTRYMNENFNHSYRDIQASSSFRESGKLTEMMMKKSTNNLRECLGNKVNQSFQEVSNNGNMNSLGANHFNNMSIQFGQTYGINNRK